MTSCLMSILLSIIGQIKSIASYKIYLEPNYANLVIKNNKIIYKLWHNCSSHEHNIEHNRQIFEHCLKA